MSIKTFNYSSRKNFAVSFFIGAMISIVLSGCAHLKHDPFYNLEHSRNVTRYTLLKLNHFSALELDIYQLKLRSRIKGSPQSNPIGFKNIAGPDLDVHESFIDWTIAAQKTVRLEKNDRQILDLQIQSATNFIWNHGLLDDFQPAITLNFVQPGTNVDREHMSFFRTKPHFQFYAELNSNENSYEFEESLINALSTVIHELTHFTIQVNNIHIPGNSPEAEEVNSETIAYAISECARIKMATKSWSGSPEVSLPFPEQPYNIDLHQYLESYGPSMIGMILAHRALSATRGNGIGKIKTEELSDGDKEQVFSACKKMLDKPVDYWDNAI